MIFQSGRKKRAYFFNSLETFNTIELNLKRTCRRLQKKVRIRHCGNFPRTNQATNTGLYKATRKNAFDTAEVLKKIRNSAIHWFLCNYVIIRTLYGLCRTRKYQTRNAILLERWEQILKAKKSGGLVREAVLLERAALLERIR